jgi:hypothetical protein
MAGKEVFKMVESSINMKIAVARMMGRILFSCELEGLEFMRISR